MRTSQILFLERFSTILELTGIMAMLLMASVFQFFLNELPCPLCLLQRLGFFAVSFGFLLNLRFGFRPSHYAIIILSALFTSFVALRQIALHIVPGTGAYGDPIFGLHLYTWSFIISMLIAVVTTVLLGFDRQYVINKPIPPRIRSIARVLFFTCLLLLAVNIVSVFMQCGFDACPENPVAYAL